MTRLRAARFGAACLEPQPPAPVTVVLPWPWRLAIVVIALSNAALWGALIFMVFG